MQGIDRSLLKTCISGLEGAYNRLNEMKVADACAIVGGGKSDTLALDWMPEQELGRVIQNYDPTTFLITEEAGKYSGMDGLEPSDVVLVCDPTDRSIKLHEFLDKAMKTHASCGMETVRSVLQAQKGEWEKSMGNAALSGASGSVTAIKGGRPVFNVMINYVTGDVYYACPLGTKRRKANDTGRIESDASVEFQTQTSCDRKFATFLKKKGYPENMNQCALSLVEADCVDPWAPGPMRILYLSDLNTDPTKQASFILCNGEKAGEWMGWLPWAMYAKDPGQGDEHALEVYRVFFESPSTKELVLMAPGPHYSIFTEKSGKSRINFSRMFQLQNPSQYRETLLVVPKHNTDAIGRVTALGQYQKRLVF